MSADHLNSLDLSLLSLCDLKNEYIKLFKSYSFAKNELEDNKQEIYELKRNLQSSIAAQEYIQQEIDQITNSEKREIEKFQEKHNTEIEYYKNKNHELNLQILSLEQKIEKSNEEIILLKDEINSLKIFTSSKSVKQLNQSIERDISLEKENLELCAKIDEQQAKINNLMILLTECERKNNALNELVVCNEENLQAKREEIEEKSELLESTQQQLSEVSAELASLKSNPDNKNLKGNSLFAEVDDQRQKMLHILEAQKKRFIQMKKCYTESEIEIRKLKRENAAMKNEIEVCVSIFVSADKRYKEKLNERLIEELQRNEALEKHNALTQENLIQLANNKGVTWLDSMLTFCKNETEEFKNKLHSCRIQKCSLENILRETKQDLAKWRLEALKLRCQKIHIENILEENNIKLKQLTATEINISEKDCINAKPDIAFPNTIQIDSKNNVTHNIMASVEEKFKENPKKLKTFEIIKNNEFLVLENAEKEYKDSNEKLLSKHEIISERNENNSRRELLKSKNIEVICEDKKLNENQEKIDENFVKIKIKPNEITTNINNENFIKDLSPILVKNRDTLFDENNMKSVQFNDSVIKIESPEIINDNTAIVQQFRTKSNVIVKRIISKYPKK